MNKPKAILRIEESVTSNSCLDPLGFDIDGLSLILYLG